MSHEENAGEALPATEHAINHPEEAPQLVQPRAQWTTIFLLGGRTEYDDWLAWHYANILGRRYP